MQLLTMVASLMEAETSPDQLCMQTSADQSWFIKRDFLPHSGKGTLAGEGVCSENC